MVAISQILVTNLDLFTSLLPLFPLYDIKVINQEAYKESYFNLFSR